MKNRLLLLCLLAALSACHSPDSVLKSARQKLAEFQSAPSPEAQAALEKSLVMVQEEVAKQEAQGHSVAASTLRRELASLQTDYQAIRAAQIITNARRAIENFGQAAKDAVQTFSEALDPTPTPIP